MSEPELERLAGKIAEIMRDLTDDERTTVLFYLPYCIHCGSEKYDGKCYCLADD